MTPEQIQNLKLPDPGVLGLNTAGLGALALEFQYTKCLLLKEIAFQLATANSLQELQLHRLIGEGNDA